MDISALEDSVFIDTPPQNESSPVALAASSPISRGEGPPSSGHRKSGSSTRRDSTFAACRICHGGEHSAIFGRKSGGVEPLISPCRCRGTMGLYHPSCLQHWLETSNTNKCEICHFNYETSRVPEPFCVTLWKNESDSIAERRNLCGDILCCGLLSPLAFAIACLCITGGMHYMNSEEHSVESPSLFTVAGCLLFTWLVWFIVCMTYHYRVYRVWKGSKTMLKLRLTPYVASPAPLPPVPEEPNPLPLLDYTDIHGSFALHSPIYWETTSSTAILVENQGATGATRGPYTNYASPASIILSHPYYSTPAPNTVPTGAGNAEGTSGVSDAVSSDSPPSLFLPRPRPTLEYPS